jgi:signal peptidase
MKKNKAPIEDTQKADETVMTSEAEGTAVLQTKTSPESKKKKVGKIVNVVVNVILIVAIIFAVICTYVSFVTTSGNGVPSIFGLRLLSIQTASMKPTINDGDLAISTSVEPEDLRPNDIITYWTVINGERVLNTHRIESIYDGGGFLIFKTKGDANTVADTLTVHERELVGKYQFRIPGVGKVFDYLQTGTGFFIVVVIPVFIFFIFHLVQFFRVLFEYQNVKNRIKFEQERDEADAEAAKQNEAQRKAEERAAMEAEIRAQLRAEMLAEMAKEHTESDSQATESTDPDEDANHEP